jgi:Family of unknown function (DUF6776)
VSVRIWWRRARQRLGISAPRMAVRRALGWPWRIVAGAALLVVVGGMWWWGFDFGQIFGGFNRREVETRMAALETETADLRSEAAELRARSAQLESDLGMAKGAEASLGKQARELQDENSQLKEELQFLEKLFAESSKQAGLAIQRLAIERDGDDTFRFALLVVRGGNPKNNDEFDGSVALLVTLQPPAGGGAAARPLVLNLPEEQPETAAALKVRFKYYQKLEGIFRVPPGAQLRSVTARLYEAGHATPRATRILSNP